MTCVKNEAPFLLEWIAWHRMAGVTDFLFYSNDCSDGTDAMLDALARRGGVVHLANPAQGRNYQMEALKDAARRPVVRAADWVWVADVDEFVNIHVGAGRFDDLIAACGAPAAISLSFQFFANCGVSAFRDRPVIGQFDRSHNPDLWCGETAIEVKTLTRADFPLWYLGAHRPFLRRGAEVPRWTDGSGRQVPDAFARAAAKRRIRKFPARGARRFATLNHYALRALDSYLLKIDRGDVNRAHRAFDDGYWRARNDPAWQDLSIRRRLPQLHEALARLKADPEIAALHRDAVAWHHARIAQLRTDPATEALRRALAAAPLLPPDEAALIARLGLKP